MDPLKGFLSVEIVASTPAAFNNLTAFQVFNFIESIIVSADIEAGEYKFNLKVSNGLYQSTYPFVVIAIRNSSESTTPCLA